MRGVLPRVWKTMLLGVSGVAPGMLSSLPAQEPARSVPVVAGDLLIAVIGSSPAEARASATLRDRSARVSPTS